jgi:hypothetical protein
VALASVSEVRRVGGLDDQDAYLLFRLPDEASLDALITDELAVAEAYLTHKAGTSYTQTADTNLQALMRRAEVYWVLMQLFEPLKARKVLGTHAPFDSEGSERYEALIDTEWGAKFEQLTGSIIADDTGSPFSLGVFLVSTPIDRAVDVECPTVRNQAILDEVTCGGGWWTR